MPKTMSHKIFAISIIQKLMTAKFCRRKTQTSMAVTMAKAECRRKFREQKLGEEERERMDRSYRQVTKGPSMS